MSKNDLIGLFLRIIRFRPRHFHELRRKARGFLKREGLSKTLRLAFKFLIYGRAYFQIRPFSQAEYECWMEKNERSDPKKIAQAVAQLKHKPVISIITPVYNIDPQWLDRCVQSVLEQYYPNWELCLYDDASTKPATLDCLKKWSQLNDSRIKTKFGKTNQHIAGASNEALKMATGEFLILLDNDDKLSPNALYETVAALNQNPRLDYIYSDEDKINEDCQRSNPFFKPDWSPDLFLSMNYTCHLSVFRKSIVEEIGGFRKGYEGSQDYDLILRFIEKSQPEKIHHIPKILYHWRTLATSTSTGLGAKDYTVRTSIKALRDYLRRNKVEGEVTEGLSPGRFYVKRHVIGNPKVSIIIPLRDQVKVLRRCVESLLKKTDYKNFEIVLVNNQSQEKETREYLKKLAKDPACKVLDYNKPFNFSAINNFAARWSKSEYLLFLNNDTEAISPEWLTAMMSQIQRDEVGAVGGKLIYPNGRIQHAGVVLGLGIAGHAFKHFPEGNEGYMSMANTIRNFSAVTAACMLVKKSAFQEVGGFDEKNFTVAYNDVDLCLRLRKKGYLIVYTPYAKLYHYESLSRGNDEDLQHHNPQKYQRVITERKHMLKKWKKWILNDPYYNPNLTRVREDFSLRIENRKPRYI